MQLQGPTQGSSSPPPPSAIPLTAKVAQAVDAAKVAAARAVPAVSEAALDRIMRENPSLNPYPDVNAKLALDVDPSTGIVVGKVIDRASGEVVGQIPSEEMLRLIAVTKTELGKLFDKKA